MKTKTVEITWDEETEQYCSVFKPLNVSTTGNTEEEAKQSLYEGVGLYVITALEFMSLDEFVGLLKEGEDMAG